MTGKRNDSIVQKQNCVVEEVKEVEFRSPRAWEIYLLQNLPFWFKKVSQFSRCGRANNRLPMKKIKPLLQKTRKVRVFAWKVFGKKNHCRLKFIDIKRYSSNCNNLKFLLKGQLQN